MDSDSKDEDATTKHVLDYYKKYSQNRELPKYFSGTSLSYLPEIKDAHSPEAELKTLLKTDIKIIVTTEDVNDEAEQVEEPADTSRASSAMSNRKLEWDSGADIGYGNCQEKRLRKSLSLPVIADVTQKKSDIEFGPVASVTRSQSSSSSDGNVKVVVLSCSSTSDGESGSSYSSKSKEKVITSSTSSNANTDGAPKNTCISISSSDSNKTHSLKQFASTLTYLKQKIGLPGAHSTPIYTEGLQSDTDIYSGTPLLKKSSRYAKEIKASSSKSPEGLSQVSLKSVDNKLTRKPSILTLPSTAAEEERITFKESKPFKSDCKKNSVKFQNQKIVNLALTKPITVECTCSSQSLTHRSLQTVATKQSSVAVQTEELSEKELVQIMKSSQGKFNNQSLIYFEYTDSDDRTNACSTQTDSDIIESHCNSFEYLKKDLPETQNDEVKSGIPSETELPEPEPLTNLKRTQNTHDLRLDLRTDAHEENSEQSSKEFCQENVPADLFPEEVDIGKSIYLLQRLLKSKKYDPVSKKRYIKKIIKRITESKYFEESSTSSDLFVPKKFQKTARTDSSGDKNEQNHLHSNLPWYPVAGRQLKLSPTKKKLALKTFTQDFLPEQHSSRDEVSSSAPEIVPINSRDTRKNRFTLTNNEFSVNHGRSTEKSKSDKTFSETDTVSLEKQYESSSSENYQNWREDKTLSEKMLEKQSEEKSHSSNGNGDCLVKFADKEREFQINWINNEISHLGKLKGLLEKPEIVQSKHRNPPDIKKSTNVYTVSNENDPESRLKRNYVIETVIGAQSTREMNFKLDGQIYTVQEYLNSKNKRERKRSRQVTGNIEVVSSDSTTNIKVTTFCAHCKGSPCQCNLQESEDDCTCDIGEICGSESCSCQRNNTLERATSAPLPAENIDKDCKKFACLCESSSSSKYENCTCCLCKKYPCECDTRFARANPKDDFSGIFIPAVPPVPTVDKFATFPSTSKEDGGRNRNYMTSILCPKCQKCLCLCGSQEVDVINRATSGVSKRVLPQNDKASSYGALKKVFENCACTQTSCTCDFVEKLMNCFAKPDVPCSTICDNKCLQTDKPDIYTVGLQTSADTQNHNQQTTTLTGADKSLQIGKYAEEIESQAIGIQNVVDTNSKIQQTTNRDLHDADVQTELSKLENNFQNIGIQTANDVKDQILQTSASIDEPVAVKQSVRSHVGSNERNRAKGVSFVEENPENSSRTSDDVKKQHERTTGSPRRVHSIGTSPNQDKKARDASVEPVTHSSVDNLKRQKGTITLSTINALDASTDIKEPQRTTSSQAVHSVYASDDVKKQQDTIASQTVPSVATSVDNLKRQKGTITLSTINALDASTDIKEPQRTTSSQAVHSVYASDDVKKQQDTTASQTVQYTTVGTSPDQDKKQRASTTSQAVAKKRIHVCSDSSRPTSSQSSRSDRHKRKVICVCCCTQTESGSRERGHRRNAKVQVGSNGTDSNKENAKRKAESFTTSSVTYEICPSILASSYNDTSQSVSEESSSKSSVVICFCCNEKYPADKISVLGTKNENYPLCCNCLATRPILTAVCYAGPEENCPCSKPHRYQAEITDVSDETKKTATDSNDIEEYCTCTKPFQRRNSKYCSYCQFKLRNTARSKNGIAYTLTLENDCLNKIRRKRKKIPLEEIRLKVPCPSSKKKHKDKENFSKRNGDKEKKCVCGKTICTNNCHVNGISSRHRKSSKKDNFTLQEHLKKNRPDFIESAESRRNVVISSKKEREGGLTDAKLKFAEENVSKGTQKKSRKLFTEQEMKEITKKNYKKLPEVQEKIHNKREQRIRNADKFIVDVFAKKIQRSVLKGKSSFPIDSNVICLPNTCNC